MKHAPDYDAAAFDAAAYDAAALAAREAEFLRRLRAARRAYPCRVVDNTAQFPAAAVRRLKMGLRAAPRDGDLELHA